MSATFGLSSGDRSLMSASVDKALDALVLPRSWPVQADGNVELPGAASRRTPPIVLQIPDLEALEVRNLEEPSWWQSPTMIKSVAMVGSVIVTVIVAAILASFKSPAERVISNDAPTWHKIPAATSPSPSPAQVYGPAVAELYGEPVVPDEKPSEPVDAVPVDSQMVDTQTARSQDIDAQQFQAAPQFDSVPQTPISASPNRQPVEVASEPALPVRVASPTWPSFDPPGDEATEEMQSVPIGRGYVNPYVESDSATENQQARTELRTADRRAAVSAGNRREVRDGAPIARLKGTIIKSNSDRSYGNTGSSLH